MATEVLERLVAASTFPRRIILSRKGFDSSAGRIPSPILPDGRIVSLPIPQANSPCRMKDVALPGCAYADNLGDIAHGLSKGSISPDIPVHLDPDIVPGARPRPQGWKPIFGQRLAALTHLEREGVREGDIFLYFGWFKQADLVEGSWRYAKGAMDLHVLFGWLQIGSVLPVNEETLRIIPWAAEHPHLCTTLAGRNAVYVATDRLTLPDGTETDLPGAGTFRKFRPIHQLTKPGASRTQWILPGWFLEKDGPTLSYHREAHVWQREGDKVHLSSAGRGQEFVFDAARTRKQSSDWIANLIG